MFVKVGVGAEGFATFGTFKTFGCMTAVHPVVVQVQVFGLLE